MSARRGSCSSPTRPNRMNTCSARRVRRCPFGPVGRGSAEGQGRDLPVRSWRSPNVWAHSPAATAPSSGINDRIDIALAVAADGVHLGGGSVTLADARRLTGDKLRLTVAAHSLADVERARDEGADAALLSPVFDSPGKGRPIGPGASPKPAARPRRSAYTRWAASMPGMPGPASWPGPTESRSSDMSSVHRMLLGPHVNSGRRSASRCTRLADLLYEVLR